MRWIFALTPLLVALLLPASHAQGPRLIFDAHLHYQPSHAERFEPEAIVAKFDRSSVQRALVTSRDPALLEELMQLAPGRIVPFLDVYAGLANRLGWVREPDLPGRVRAQIETGLATGEWAGIGELHIFAGDRQEQTFEALIAIADEFRLPVMIHGDPAVIDRAYELHPELRILWAHAGTFPYPPLVRDYLNRYPNLYVDLSMRSDRLNAEVRIPEEWELLLIDHASRFMVGVDTFSLRRWQAFDQHVAEIHSWLEQLPDDVAEQIAFANAQRLFPE